MVDLVYSARTSKVERAIAKTYLMLLPVRMISPLLGIASFFHGAAIYVDFLLHIMGIALYLVNSDFVIRIGRRESDNLFKSFFCTVLALNLCSLIMAVYTQFTVGNYAGETAFSGILGMEIYFFQYVLIIAYNRRIFHILSMEEIKQIISRVCIFLLMLGYYQMLVLLIGGPFREILNRIDIFHILWPEANMPKLSLTGAEGATAGTIFGILVLPYLLSCIINNQSKTWAIVQCVLWIPVLALMKSTTAYLVVLADIFGFGYCMLKSSKGTKKMPIIVILASIIMILFVLFSGEILLRSVLPEDISYLVFDKIKDLNNGSTVARMVPFVTNWNAFLQHPILGVGNGLQGYYYIQFFPEWAKNVAGSDVMTFYRTAQSQIINGGLFFPGLLSGYGIVGGVLIILFLRKLHMRAKKLRMHHTELSDYFSIAVWAIIVCGFQSELAGNYFVWFVISLPFADYYTKDGAII